MKTSNEASAAEAVLNIRRGASEAKVQSAIQRLLEAHDVSVTPQYPTPGGHVDLYCHNRRLLLEVKAAGKAADADEAQARTNPESPKEQLERYMRSEIERELSELPYLEPTPWIGVVTDGLTWHVWRYGHESGAVAQRVGTPWTPQTTEGLTSFVRKTLLAQRKIGKPDIPADPRPVFEAEYAALQNLYETQEHQIKERTTKKHLWHDMLRIASMEPPESAIDRLFVTHSFLITIARGVIASLANPQRDRIEAPDSLREGFAGWIVDTPAGKEWAQSVFNRIHTYEWRRHGDVLRPLYEALVDEHDRKIFGEYYTPDWLAELIVEEVLDNEWCRTSVDKAVHAIETGKELRKTGVLDPACGSGTFLYHAARRILKAKPAGLKDEAPGRQAQIIARLVNGIDIHPVAAELARATLLRALPALPADGQAALQVYQGDSLLIQWHGEYSLFDQNQIIISSKSGGTALLPQAFVTHERFPLYIRKMIELAQDRDKPDLPSYIRKCGGDTHEQAVMSEAYDELRRIIEKDGNSIWTWYIVNIAGPYLLANRKVDRVVANPPWVRMADVQNEDRKRQLERFAANRMKIWTGGKQAPHFDIASLFIKRTREQYLAKPGSDPAGWLVKKAALKAGSWNKFRDWHKDVVTQTLDLEPLQPFGGGDARRSCVLLEKRRFERITDLETREIVASCTKPRPERNDQLDGVRQRLQIDAAKAAISTASSGYLSDDDKPLFRQGATIVPKVLVIVEHVEDTESATEKRVRTARSQHAPWRDRARQKGRVPAHWIRPILTSKDVFPFATVPTPANCIVPTEDGGELLEAPEQECEFWKDLERVYRHYCGKGRGTPKTLIERIDFGAALTVQMGLAGRNRNRVLYPLSGDIMRAAFTHDDGVIDSSLYYWQAQSRNEALYLVTVLNAECLREAFVQCRESGRHFHLHPWRKVPIPRFDKANRKHIKLTELGAKATTTAKKCMAAAADHLGQVGVSKRIRKGLHDAGLAERIDDIVRKIMPSGVAQAKSTATREEPS